MSQENQISNDTEEKKIFSDFWLNKEAIYQYIPKGGCEEFSMDLIQLASYRRIVSNFVFILTHLDIPVQFCSQEKSTLNFTDGRIIHLSASIRKKSDFDWSVGIALHEASHIMLTDFNLVERTFSVIPIPIPAPLKKQAKEKNLSEKNIARVCKWVWNYIEDRYIDSYIFKEAPGYRGYYKAMYEKFFNNPIISKGLKSSGFRKRNLVSYEYRVINLTNPDTDLDALPGLRQIAELIDIENIFRLSKTSERLDLAYRVAEIVIKNIKKQKTSDDQNPAKSTIKKVHEKLSSKECLAPDGIGGPQNEENNSNQDEEDGESDPDDAGEMEDLSSEDLKKLIGFFNELRNILDHKYQNVKEGVTNRQQSILSVIEESGITLVGTGYGFSGDYKQASVECIIVKKLTKQLIDSGQNVFPLAAKDFCAPGKTRYAPEAYDQSVAKGFTLGKLLGKKLKIRGEENTIKFIRKSAGKIERRLLADIGAGMENIFNRVKIERYNKARLHISVDSSGSMFSDSKWCPTMTCVVAICVAASMIENLSVSVSFRSTINLEGYDVPYIVLAYDSKTDPISKVRQLFPYLRANGATPEGLAFEAIAEEFIIGRKTTEQDHYFLNLSDGEPCYIIAAEKNKYGVGFNYAGEIGALHTKAQIDKIRSKGVKILSYFIDGDYNRSIWSSVIQSSGKQLSLNQLFKIMYGNDAKMIDVENITDVARTINKLFLSKV